MRVWEVVKRQIVWGALAASAWLVTGCGGGDDEVAPAPTPPQPDVRETSIAPVNVVSWGAAHNVEVRGLAPASDGGAWATGIVTGAYPKPFLRYYGPRVTNRCGSSDLVVLDELIRRLEKPQAFAVEVAEGYVLVGGLSPTGFNVSRYREQDCSLDSTFGEGGVAHLPHPRLTSSTPRAYLAQDTSGRILIGGSRNGQIAIWRLMPDGSVDTTYGDNGLAFTKVPDNFSVGAVAAGVGGSLFVGGAVSKPFGFIPAVAKLGDAGALNPSFGLDGVARLAELSKGTGSIRSLIVDGGRVILAGNTTDSVAADSWAGNDSFIAALNAENGHFSTDFATGGWAMWDWGFNGSNMVLAMTKNRRGGYSTCGHIIRGLLKQSISLADFDNDGQPDGAVGVSGRRLVEGTDIAGDCFAITQTGAGDLVVGGIVSREGYLATVE